MLEERKNPMLVMTYHTDKLDCDLKDLNNVEHPIDFALKNHESMLHEMIDESNRAKRPTQHCLALQTQINSRMRRILIDWMVEVHIRFKLLPETLFITVNLMDRFAQGNHIPKKEFQLVGVTCMLIAGKYEEIYPPLIENYVDITDRAYTKQDIIEKERDVLQFMQFDMTFATIFRFLQRYSRLGQCTQMVFSLAQYCVELSLIEVTMNKYPADLLACSAIYVGKKMMQQRQPAWSTLMSQYTGHCEANLKPCVRDICLLLKNAHVKTYYQALYKKF